MQEAKEQLLTNFPLFAEKLLKIKTKSKGIIPFVLNKPQRELMAIAERQRKEFGYVRILALKGRQEGISTLIAGWLYAQVTRRKGINALVIAHDTKTTKLLFGMVKHFHEEMPKEMRQPTSKLSEREIEFSNLKSTYTVATAGSEDGGRGGTLQLVHCSEVAFWGDAEGLITGLFQSIPSGLDIEGSEVYLESTANGEQGFFYDVWMAAELAIREGKTPAFIPVFLPWYWMKEYRVILPEVYSLDDEEIEYRNFVKQEMGYTLDDAQLLWRRFKLESEFITNKTKFKQEYPATAQEAFESSLDGAFFDRETIMRAREDKGFPEEVGARVAALDPGGEGENSDRTAIGHGDDLGIDNIEYHEGLDPSDIAEMAIKYIKKHRIQVMWIDAIGIGSGVISIMKRKGYGKFVRPFIANASSLEFFVDPSTGKKTKLYDNKKAEAHGRFRKWLGDGTMVQIPDDQDLYVDILKPMEFRHPKSGVIIVESKTQLRSRGVSSPDGLDVCVMIKCEEIPENLNTDRDSGVININQNFNLLKNGLYK